MDLRTRAALAVALLGASMALSAGVNTWSAIGPDGGGVRKVVYHRDTPTTVYMIADGGFFRSLDAGATWQLVKNDFLNAPSDLDVDPTDQNRVYAVSPSTPTMLVSTDAGATFTPVTSFPNVGNAWMLEVSADGKTLYAAAGLRVFRSQDRGVTWQERAAIGAAPGVPNRMLVDPTDNETLYALAPSSSNTNGLFVTHNGAASWAQLTDAAQAAVFALAGLRD